MNHLRKVCMTYTQHCLFSMSISVKLLIGSLKAFVHAWIPNIFTSSTTLLIQNLDNTIKNTGCK